MSTKMTNTQLIDAISAATELSKADVSRVLDGFKAVATTGLNEGKSVPLVNFGTFKPTQRSAREGRNPSTGEPLQIAASNGVSFSAAKGLKEARN
jgi:DNA-binding protein HU-beta